jgi:hypothetical protein
MYAHAVQKLLQGGRSAEGRGNEQAKNMAGTDRKINPANLHCGVKDSRNGKYQYQVRKEINRLALGRRMVVLRGTVAEGIEEMRMSDAAPAIIVRVIKARSGDIVAYEKSCQHPFSRI